MLTLNNEQLTNSKVLKRTFRDGWMEIAIHEGLRG